MGRVVISLVMLTMLAACSTQKVVRRDATVNLTGVELVPEVMEKK